MHLQMLPKSTWTCVVIHEYCVFIAHTYTYMYTCSHTFTLLHTCTSTHRCTQAHTHVVHCYLNNHLDCDFGEECQLAHITDESSAQTQIFGVHVCTRSMKEMQFLFSQRPGIYTQTHVHNLLSSQNTPAHTCTHISECNTHAHTCTHGVSLSQHSIQHRILFCSGALWRETLALC